jgi:hypothetical protein
MGGRKECSQGQQQISEDISLLLFVCYFFEQDELEE